MDDLVFDDHWWAVMVAILALRLDRIFYFRHLDLHVRSDRRYLPYQLPRCHSSVIRYLGFAVACVQQGCDGLYMVRGAVMDWGYVFSVWPEP